ncbi:MAG: TIGR03546 family protein [Planctomycetota bacterium]
MLLFLVKTYRTLRRVIAARRQPAQLAWGLAFGLLLGVIPHGNLLALVLLIGILCLKLNHAAMGLTALGVTFVASTMDPVSHQVGDWVLTQPSLQSLLVSAWALPLVPWTDLNNTVVMGSFLIGVAALVPTFLVTYPVLKWLAPRDSEIDPDDEPEANVDAATMDIPQNEAPPETAPDMSVQPPHTPVQPPHTPVQPPHTPVQPPHTPVQPPHTPVQPTRAPVPPPRAPEPTPRVPEKAPHATVPKPHFDRRPARVQPERNAASWKTDEAAALHVDHTQTDAPDVLQSEPPPPQSPSTQTPSTSGQLVATANLKQATPSTVAPTETIETRIDVVRASETNNHSPQAMDEALNYLLRQLRDHHKGDAA